MCSRFGEPAAPLFFVVDPSRFPDVPVDLDDLSSNRAPLALSFEAPVVLDLGGLQLVNIPRVVEKSREFG